MFDLTVMKKVLIYCVNCQTTRYMNVQWQSGGCDCGLFAPAFAIELCFKRDPIAPSFNQVKMREHLIKDIEQQSQFQVLKSKQNIHLVTFTSAIPVYSDEEGTYLMPF